MLLKSTTSQLNVAAQNRLDDDATLTMPRSEHASKAHFSLESDWNTAPYSKDEMLQALDSLSDETEVDDAPTLDPNRGQIREHLSEWSAPTFESQPIPGGLSPLEDLKTLEISQKGVLHPQPSAPSEAAAPVEPAPSPMREQVRPTVRQEPYDPPRDLPPEPVPHPQRSAAHDPDDLVSDPDELDQEADLYQRRMRRSRILLRVIVGLAVLTVLGSLFVSMILMIR